MFQCNYNGEKDVCRACNLYLGSKFRYHMKSSKECSNKLKKLFEELKLKQKKETLEISNQMKKLSKNADTAQVIDEKDHLRYKINSKILIFTNVPCTIVHSTSGDRNTILTTCIILP